LKRVEIENQTKERRSTVSLMFLEIILVYVLCFYLLLKI